MVRSTIMAYLDEDNHYCLLKSFKLYSTRRSGVWVESEVDEYVSTSFVHNPTLSQILPRYVSIHIISVG